MGAYAGGNRRQHLDDGAVPDLARAGPDGATADDHAEAYANANTHANTHANANAHAHEVGVPYRYATSVRRTDGIVVRDSGADSLGRRLTLAGPPRFPPPAGDYRVVSR